MRRPGRWRGDLGLAGSTVRAIDLRDRERWKAKRRMPALSQMGAVEAIDGDIKTLLRLRGRGYKNLPYLLLEAQRMAVTSTEFVVFQKAA